MAPLLVAEAEDANDVLVAVKWAAGRGYKAVARSGGHQYCGLSSGGEGTVLVDLRRLNHFSPVKDGKITVGPGVQLQTLSKLLVDAGVSIPHGECPLVNIGGHVQTGGVGHQIRSLGVTLDWVREFKMVAWDGNGTLAEHVYPKPVPGQPLPTDATFAAVLGGGPGSWGVITSITFDVSPDADHPSSCGYTRAFWYDLACWTSAFAAICDWAEREHQCRLPAGIDLFVSVISGSLDLLPNATIRPPVVLIETTALAQAHKAAISEVVERIAARASCISLPYGGPNGDSALSKIVHSGVRATGALGGMPGGREFDLPYKKSTYVTRCPLPDDFQRGFVDLVDRVHRHPGTRVVFQGVLGGGNFKKKGSTQMQHRDALLQIVFDVFYEEGYAQVAEGFQKEMLDLWTRFLPDEQSRMFWGTYEDPGSNGAQLDMSQSETQERYYDSAAAYASLQHVKSHVDPGDVFHTSFTVRPSRMVPHPSARRSHGKSVRRNVPP